MPNPFTQMQQNIEAVQNPVELDTAAAPAPGGGGETLNELEASPFGRFQKYLELTQQKYLPLMEAEEGPLTSDDRLNLFAVAATNPVAAREYLQQRAQREADRKSRNLKIQFQAIQDALAMGSAERDADESDRAYELRLMDFEERHQQHADSQATNALQRQLYGLDAEIKQENLRKLRSQVGTDGPAQAAARAYALKLLGKPKDALGLERYTEAEAWDIARQRFGLAEPDIPETPDVPDVPTLGDLDPRTSGSTMSTPTTGATTSTAPADKASMAEFLAAEVNAGRMTKAEALQRLRGAP